VLVRGVFVREVFETRRLRRLRRGVCDEVLVAGVLEKMSSLR
jgi:hypothetical protein